MKRQRLRGLLHVLGFWAWIGWVVFMPFKITVIVGVICLGIIGSFLWYKIGFDS